MTKIRRSTAIHYILLVTMLMHLFNFTVLGPISLSIVALLLGTLFAPLLLNVRAQIPPRNQALLAVIVVAILMVFIDALILFDLSSATSVFIQLKVVSSWIYITFYVFVGYRCYEYIFSKRLLRGLATTSLLVSTLVLILIIVGPAGSSSAVRLTLQEALPGGINGFLLSTFFLQVAAFSAYRDTRYIGRKLIYSLAMALPLLNGLLLGSRQYSFSIVLFFMLWALATGKLSNRLRKLIIGGLALGFVFLILMLVPFMRTVFMERFNVVLGRIDRQYDPRIVLFEKVEPLLKDYTYFGRGLNWTRNYLQHSMDSGYLEFFIDYGLIVSVVFITALLFTHIKLFLRASSVLRKYRGATHLMFLFYTGIYFFWYAFFNEVLRDYVVWVFLGALIAIQPRSRLSSLSSTPTVFRVSPFN
ncbi:hypothetical protein [Candidatus Marimicrobium litorale]|uniref:Uncharacterized protein n=1 Tax=Candidatus Marimicrobium litorale TaxID=2518991 RepID=A0ABT3T541_9GAMM|nr:hypothetical protein [Candidatus Marimicrobium litorale]MCX2977397.1 hypothetical protein [Candidatus Marimicrobium litorale]